MLYVVSALLKARLDIGNDLIAFKGVFDVRKLERFLVGAGAQNIETARSVKALRGNCFLRCQEMASGLPNLLLLESVHTCGRVPFLVIPNRLDFNKNESPVIAGDNVEFSAMVSVITGDNLVAFAHQECHRLRLYKISLSAIAGSLYNPFLHFPLFSAAYCLLSTSYCQLPTTPLPSQASGFPK